MSGRGTKSRLTSRNGCRWATNKTFISSTSFEATKLAVSITYPGIVVNALAVPFCHPLRGTCSGLGNHALGRDVGALDTLSGDRGKEQ